MKSTQQVSIELALSMMLLESIPSEVFTSRHLGQLESLVHNAHQDFTSTIFSNNLLLSKILKFDGSLAFYHKHHYDETVGYVNPIYQTTIMIKQNSMFCIGSIGKGLDQMLLCVKNGLQWCSANMVEINGTSYVKVAPDNKKLSQKKQWVMRHLQYLQEFVLRQFLTMWKRCWSHFETPQVHWVSRRQSRSRDTKIKVKMKTRTRTTMTYFTAITISSLFQWDTPSGIYVEFTCLMICMPKLTYRDLSCG